MAKTDMETANTVTVSLDDDTYRRVHAVAERQGTSVSALVTRFLVELGAGERDIERLKRDELALRERITGFRAANNLSRDAVHRRDR